MTQGSPEGSLWRKWDLHVHSPYSIVQNYGGNTEEIWEKFFCDLEALPPEFKVIGINDYLFVDGYERVLKAKREGGRLRNIDLILPVVEFRLDKFGGVVKKDPDGTYSKSDWSRINLHIIFDQLDPEVIRQQFLSSLVPCYDLIPEAAQFKARWQAVITRDSLQQLGKMIIDAAPEEKRASYDGPLQEGFNNLNVGLDSILKALERRHDLKDRFLLAVGKTEWENMKWDDQSIAEKRNVINKVDLVFTASPNPAAYSKAKDRLSESGVLSKLLDCSDAHWFSDSTNKDRIGRCYTWIKGDPTFQGLRHAVTEFDQRVYVGDAPPKRILVDSNKTKYASWIAIKKNQGSLLPDAWFDARIPLNHDLVAIIGNKGSGKSALSDVIALVGDTRNNDGFSFLSDKRFRDPKSKLASHFTASLGWHDGTDSKKGLHENPPISSVERIKYLPQSYLETLCNELANNGSSTFDGELRKIIYTHVPDEQRLGFRSLDELLNFKVSELESEQKLLLNGLSKLNAEIVGVESQLTSEFRQTLEQQLDAKKKELSALESAKPVQVDDPLESDAAKQETSGATARLGALEAILNTIKSEEHLARQKKADALKNTAHIVRISQAIKNYQKVNEQFVVELNGMLSEVQPALKASDLISLKVNTSELERLSAAFKAESDFQETVLAGQGDGSLKQRRDAAELEISTITSRLGEKQRLFLVFKEQLTLWEMSIKELQGEKDKGDSIAGIEAQIKELETLPTKREQLKASRIEAVRKLHQQIGKIVAEYRILYQPVQAFVQSAAKLDMPLPLNFNVRIAEDGFQDIFLGRINRQARGSFSGVDESTKIIRDLLKQTDLMNEDEVVSLVYKIDDMLHFDRRIEGENQPEVSLSAQLRKGNRAEDLYDYLFGLDYLRPQYSLTYNEQEISQLSPGERGLLLLVFYLLVDKDDIPLVIDQPEENLDNQTIYKILVSCIKTAKQCRQVIMVTHNPNLAVVCDAEQIICATCDKANKQFSYISGAIESPEIKARVIELLEGTEPAFVNRQQKYGL